MKPSKRIWPWLIVSLVIAATSCFGPRFYPYDPVLQVSVALSCLWAIIVLAAIILNRQQGLWLLVGAPLALFTPVVLFLWVRACQSNINACP